MGIGEEEKFGNHLNRTNDNDPARWVSSHMSCGLLCLCSALWVNMEQSRVFSEEKSNKLENKIPKSRNRCFLTADLPETKKLVHPMWR